MTKRKREAHGKLKAAKKQRLESADMSHASIVHPVLSAYYSRVVSLRTHLIEQLPKTSARRKVLAKRHKKKTALQSTCEATQELEDLLDSVLVGVCDFEKERRPEYSREVISQYSQQKTLSGGTESQNTCLSSIVEILECAIWLLFHRVHSASNRPPHLLCQGFQRAVATWQNRTGRHLPCSIPGMAPIYPNEHVETLKRGPWLELPRVLGSNADCILLNLFMNHGIFARNSDGLYQLSGRPLSELIPTQHVQDSSASRPKETKAASVQVDHANRVPSSITFVRHRMFYARPMRNSKGAVTFGLRLSHVFNRYPDSTNPEQTCHIMKYIFPRQYGLHNVFTSSVDARETAQPFKDYTTREHEIQETVTRMGRSAGKGNNRKDKLPRRLRGPAFKIVESLRRRHQRCSYTQLLHYYCASPPSLCGSQNSATITSDTHFSQFATRVDQVSAFCRTAVKKVFPRELLDGRSGDGSNWHALMRSIDAFVRARRFESFTLQHFLHGMAPSRISWLQPKGVSPEQSMSLSDFRKRTELLAEVVYYIFDSFLIPLIRANFYVTDSAQHRNKLFYFRHDVWNRLTEPAIASLKTTVLEECKVSSQSWLHNQGVASDPSRIRLLPKQRGMRPVINLRRRRQISLHGRKMMGKSVNSALAPAFQVLNFEKANQSDRFGASLFSIGSMLQKLQEFREALLQSGIMGNKLYMAKVDVQSCFDTLPQRLLTKLVDDLLSAEEYHLIRQAEIKPGFIRGKPLKKFFAVARLANDSSDCEAKGLSNKPKRHKQSISIQGHVPQLVSRTEVCDMIKEHVANSMVKIGKKTYRQKQGIPQGSIVSSILCNLAYSDFERRHLHFLNDGHSLLLRLIDDFLLITASREKAIYFLELMHGGCQEYGITVKREKSMANFDVAVKGATVPKLAQGERFPYCGVEIDQRNLEIAKSKPASGLEGGLADALTVEYSKTQGQVFRRKILSTTKIQMQSMLLDPGHNSSRTMLDNLYGVLMESATKTYQYLNNVDGLKHPEAALLIRLVRDLVNLASSRTFQSGHKNRVINTRVIAWLTIRAFLGVFSCRQARFGRFVGWLQNRNADHKRRNCGISHLLESIVARREQLSSRGT